MEKKKILIINKDPFGTLTDVYKWCYYLRDEYEVTLLCFDAAGLEKLIMEGVSVKYVSYKGSFAVRGIRYLIHSLWYLLFFKGNILVVYFEHCNLLKRLIPWKKMILDIRTLSVNPYPARRKASDDTLIKSCKVYDLVTVISEGVKEKIGNVGKTVKILPLGADCIANKEKDYSLIKLIYVGTFSGRNLDKTIKGVACFSRKHPDVALTYNIIGSGYRNELEEYKKIIEELGLASKVILRGRIPHYLLSTYFDDANIGVSFVPITEYYNHQPPTKTFEYALSGLFTIATDTSENQKIITSENGILIQDTVEDFAQALEFVYEKKHLFNEQAIRDSLKESTWSNVVNRYLKSVL